MALRYHPRCALIDAMHTVDAETRRWQWVPCLCGARRLGSQIIDQRSIIMEAGSWSGICTMIALTYDCYYTTDMTLAGAGKRAHLVPGDRYRPGYGQTLICLINLRKHGRTFQGNFPRWAVCCERCCGLRTRNRIESATWPLMPHQSPSSRSRAGYSSIQSKHIARFEAWRIASDSSRAGLRGSISGNSRGNESRRHAARERLPGPIGRVICSRKSTALWVSARQAADLCVKA
jgi:hypothetical protein